jgi:hypothetical protein
LTSLIKWVPLLSKGVPHLCTTWQDAVLYVIFHIDLE